MRLIFMTLIISLAMVVASCSSNPTIPSQKQETGNTAITSFTSNHWLWGNWEMFIPANHSRALLVPMRVADKHYNVKMLLENDPCDNCIWVSHFTNNGDGTVSVEVSIRHPYPFQKQYTGFDVRGIVYTQTDYYFDDTGTARHFPALEAGDLELLNPDGYASAYSPFNPNPQNYPPIQKYQPNGDLGGTFDSNDQEGETYYNLWPFINYFSSETRRYFATDAVVSRTYHLALPPGQWEYGYAVDACWAPPVNTPVIDIVNDFPKNANTLLTYDIKVTSSGHIIGSGSTDINIRVYAHFPDILEIYTPGALSIYNYRLTGKLWDAPNTGPTIVDDQYAEYTYELSNILDRPPGKYPILFMFGGSFPYIGEIEQKWWLNAELDQIFWVTVE